MEQVVCALKQTPATGIGTPLDIVKGMGENLFKSLADCFSDFESREKTLGLVAESLEKQLKDLEEDRKKQMKVLEEDRNLERRSEELELREEKLDEQLNSVREHIESLEVTRGQYEALRLRECEKLKEIEKREREIESSRWSLEKRLREVEKREKDFDTFRSEKLRELSSEEEVLRRKRKEFVEEVKLADEKLWEKQKLGRNLIERLELALNMLQGMKVMIDGRFKEFESWKALAYESLNAKFKEAESIQESLEKQVKEVEKIGREINLLHEDKARNLESKEPQVGTMGTEILKANLPEQQKVGIQPSQCSEQLVAKNESKELTLNVAFETLEANPKDVKLCMESANRRSQESIAYKDQQLDCRTIEAEVEGNIQSERTAACFTIDPQEPVDLKLSLQKDGKSLKMLMNDSHRDLELMDKEIFRLLLLSSDPGKFVLDAVRGFYTAHLGNGGKELTVGNGIEIIVLLHQLTKMSPNIEACVRESATEIALEWKSRMTPTTENQLEVLGLLHLLAAYNLSSYFDKNELFSLVKTVAQHKQTPELCRILGLADKMPGLIQNLINEKQYLLASTYIYECGLENMFPQAAVLNYYVNHARLSAKAKYRWKCRSSQAQDMRFASEIADLQVAIEHIIKYGLESEYSPGILTARIKQLERNQASLRNRRPYADIHSQKQGNNKRARSPNEGEHEEAATARHSPAWNVQNEMSGREIYPVGSHQHRDFAATARYSPAWNDQNQTSEMESYPVGSHQRRDFVATARHSPAWNDQNQTSEMESYPVGSHQRSDFVATAGHSPAWNDQNQTSEMESYPVGSHQRRHFVDRAPTRHPPNARKRRRNSNWSRYQHR